VHNVDPEKKPSTWYLLDTYDPFLSYTNLTTTQRLSGTTGGRVIENTGHRGTASISISNANGKYLVKLPNLDFSGRQGYSYRISGWIKGTNATGGTGALGFQLQNNKSYVVATPYDRDFLEDSLLTYGFQFSIDKWDLLGTYAFNAGATTVTLTHPGGTGLWSSADAVRFVPVP